MLGCCSSSFILFIFYSSLFFSLQLFFVLTTLGLNFDWMPLFYWVPCFILGFKMLVYLSVLDFVDVLNLVLVLDLPLGMSLNLSSCDWELPNPGITSTSIWLMFDG